MKEKHLQCAGYVALLAGAVVADWTMKRLLLLVALCVFGIPWHHRQLRAPHE